MYFNSFYSMRTDSDCFSVGVSGVTQSRSEQDVSILRIQNTERSECSSHPSEGKNRIPTLLSRRERSEQNTLVLRTQNKKRSECPFSSFRMVGSESRRFSVGVSGVSQTRSEQSGATSHATDQPQYLPLPSSTDGLNRRVRPDSHFRAVCSARGVSISGSY